MIQFNYDSPKDFVQYCKFNNIASYSTEIGY